MDTAYGDITMILPRQITSFATPHYMENRKAPPQFLSGPWRDLTHHQEKNIQKQMKKVNDGYDHVIIYNR